MIRVPGHALRAAPHSDPTCHDEACAAFRRRHPDAAATAPLPVVGTGHALCECGALSGHLASQRARAVWHRLHKRDLA